MPPAAHARPRHIARDPMRVPSSRDVRRAPAIARNHGRNKDLCPVSGEETDVCSQYRGTHIDLLPLCVPLTVRTHFREHI